MFDLADIFEIPGPTNWFWWWVMFVPVLGIAIAYWVSGGSWSGWGIAILTAFFCLLSAEFARSLWKVFFRAGVVLSGVALGVMFAAAITVEASDPALAAWGAVFYPMHKLALLPFMGVGLILTTIGGVLGVWGGSE